MKLRRDEWFSVCCVLVPSNCGTRIEIDRVERSLSADIEPIAVLSSEADICDDLSDRDRAEMRTVGRIVKHAATCRRPYVSMDVTAKSVEQSLGTGGEQRTRSDRLAVHLVRP